MAGNFEPATKSFTSPGRLEKQKQQNKYGNKGKKTHQPEQLTT